MADIIVRVHPTNPSRVVIFHLNKWMKMLAVNEDLEVVQDLVPVKNFFKGIFTKDGHHNMVHFCILPMIRSNALFWDDEHIMDAVSAYHKEMAIGTMLSLVETRINRIMFELATTKV